MSIKQPTLTTTDYWRAVILYGVNIAPYKIARASVLIDLAQEQRTSISMPELARSFFRAYWVRIG